MARLLLVLPLLAVLTGCTGLFFHPAEPWVRTPADIGLEYRNVYFGKPGRPRLHGWFLPAEGEARGTVVFFHGNAENVSTHIGSVYWLPERGFNVFLADYRGYGSSEGIPTAEGLVHDIRSTVEHTLTMEAAHRGPVVVWGQSLGGALLPAALYDCPCREDIAGIIMDSPFYGFRDIAREKLAQFWLTWPLQYPLAWTIDDTYSPDRFIKALSPSRLLIVHNRDDPAIPAHHSRRLYAAARPPVGLWILRGGGHIRTTQTAAARDELVQWLEQRMTAQPRH